MLLKCGKGISGENIIKMVAYMGSGYMESD